MNADTLAYVQNMRNEIIDLKKQVESMKCCGNCNTIEGFEICCLGCNRLPENQSSASLESCTDNWTELE